MGTNVPQFDSETSRDELNQKIMSIFEDVFQLQELAKQLYADEKVLSESADTKKLKLHLNKLKTFLRDLDFDYAYLTSYLSEHCN